MRRAWMCLMLCVAACSSEGASTVEMDAAAAIRDLSARIADAAEPPTAIEIVATTNMLTVGASTSLMLRAAFAGDLSTPTDVTAEATWQTSDATIATIDNGRVVAVAPGSVELIAEWHALTSLPLTLVINAPSAYSTPPVLTTHLSAASGHRMWAHYNFQGLPDYIYNSVYPASARSTFYEELYPLYARYGYPTTPPAYDADLWSYMRDAGLTGVFLLQYSGGATSGIANEDGDISTWMAGVEAAGEAIQIAITLAPSDDVPANVVASIEHYCDCATGTGPFASSCGAKGAHPSAARVDGKLLVELYASDNLVTSGQAGETPWQYIREKLTQDGYSIFLIGDFTSAGLSASKVAAASLQYFDAVYNFGYKDVDDFYDFASLANTAGKPFIGGAFPGYDRENVTGGGYIPFAATLLLRQLWQAAVGAGVDWNQLETWADTQENTQLEPTSEWSFTRGDIDHWFSTQLGAQSKTAGDSVAKLYVTTPTNVHLDQNAPAEALLLNGSASPITVTLRFVDSDGRLFGNEATSSVAAGQLGTATLNAAFDTLPKGHFVRALATTSDGQQVTSAPILIYDRFEAPDLRLLYYSIPADHALAGVIGLTVQSGAAVVVPPTTSLRYVEVLQNTRQACDEFLQLAGNRCAVPLTYATQPGFFSSPFTTYTSYEGEGFYVARVVDVDGNVGYSDPVYVPPAGVSGAYTLINKNSLLALDLSSGSLVQSTRGPSTTQNWQLTDLGNAFSTITNVATMQSLSAEPSDGSASLTLASGNLPASQWSLRYFDQQAYDGAYYLIVNRVTGLALGVAGHSQSVGAAITQVPLDLAWADANNDDANNDKWRVEPVVGP